MFSYFFAQVQSPSAEDIAGEVFQGVLPSIAIMLLIGGALLLVVFLLRFAAKMNALPKAAQPPSATPGGSAQGTEMAPLSSSMADISIQAQNYQSVSVQWFVPLDLSNTLNQNRGNSLMIRLLDVTQIDLASQLPHAIYDYPCDWSKDDTPQVMGIAVVQGDRDYIAELGYMTADRQWRQLARSSHVRVAATVASS